MDGHKAVRLRIWVPLLAAALLCPLPAAAACLLPAPPSRIPDGTSATEQEMVAAMRTLKQYNDDVDEYTKCLQFEQRTNRMTFSEQEMHRDVALNKLATVAELFNEQVRRFKARHS
ncbi:MAG: hypothetical protein WDM77_13785 [Steroidobacteraceae bacterium]